MTFAQSECYEANSRSVSTAAGRRSGILGCGFHDASDRGRVIQFRHEYFAPLATFLAKASATLAGVSRRPKCSDRFLWESLSKGHRGSKSATFRSSYPKGSMIRFAAAVVAVADPKGKKSSGTQTGPLHLISFETHLRVVRSSSRCERTRSGAPNGSTARTMLPGQQQIG